MRRPLDPNLPPDTPLEPGSGVPRSKPGSPAARIAASEAALGGAHPAMAEVGGKSAAIAAARNAAQSYQAEATEDGAPKRSLFSLLSFFKSNKPKLPKPPKAAKAPKPPKAPKPQKLPASLDPDAAPLTTRQKVIKQLKTLVIAVSVVIIILGTLQTAMDFFMAPAEAPAQSEPAEDRAPDTPTPSAPATAPARPPGRPMPTPDGAVPAPEPNTTQSINRTSRCSIRPPCCRPPGNSRRRSPTSPVRSIARLPAPAVTADPAVNALPASFGPALRAAAVDRRSQRRI